jgi:hypothetical protein
MLKVIMMKVTVNVIVFYAGYQYVECPYAIRHLHLGFL